MKPSVAALLTMHAIGQIASIRSGPSAATVCNCGREFSGPTIAKATEKWARHVSRVIARRDRSVSVVAKVSHHG